MPSVLSQGREGSLGTLPRCPAPQVPVFIWAPEEEGQFQPGRCLRWWLHSSLRAFEADLAALGSRLVYARSTESRLALGELAREIGAQAVLFNHLYDPISMVSCCAPCCWVYSKGLLAAAGAFLEARGFVMERGRRCELGQVLCCWRFFGRGMCCTGLGGRSVPVFGFSGGQL